MNDTEDIEAFFKNSPSREEKEQFEKRILEDADFAREVAFYISANEAIHQELWEEKKQRFREIYEGEKVVSKKAPVRQLWRYMAAAGVLIIVLLAAWFFVGSRQSPKQLADHYIKQNFESVSVTMNTRDSLQMGLNLLNTERLPEALHFFEDQLQSDPSSSVACKYAGIISLRLANYATALEYFSRLEADTGLFSNPGTFYKAVTLLSRNKAGDKERAKELLEKVIDEGLEGKKEAIEWVKKL